MEGRKVVNEKDIRSYGLGIMIIDEICEIKNEQDFMKIKETFMIEVKDGILGGYL